MNFKANAVRKSRYHAYQRGAVSVEALIILPVITWLIIASLQLVWIFWAQHTLHQTSHYVLRAGQIQHGSKSKMLNVLATGMASTKLQWHDKDSTTELESLREHVWKATLETLIHAKLAAKIIVHSPDDAAFKNYSERRFDLRLDNWVTEVSIDHAIERAKNSDDPAAWLDARQLDIEIWWCLPLEIPFVASALQNWHQLMNSEAQRFCRLRETIIGKPLWPLITRRKGPMLSGFRTTE